MDHTSKVEAVNQKSYNSRLTPSCSAVDITEDKDGGVLKELLKEGTVEEYPMLGDRVTITYDAFFADGNCFDSSHFRSDNKFEFILGKGLVVKAWDLAVRTMKAGEKSRFFCKDSYVYTDETDSPQQNTVVYDIELLYWQGADVSKRKDGGIRKSTLVKGEGLEMPNDGATCDVHITGTCNGRVFEDRDVTFVMGCGSESGLVPGVEMALRKFHRAESARLKVSAKYGYGSEGCLTYNIPPGAELAYEVNLQYFVRAKDHWEMEWSELLSCSEQFKDKGTEFFKAGKYPLARRQYKKIVEYLSSETDRSEAAKHLVSAGHLNLAICYLKLGRHRQARDACNSCLQLEPNSIKALYRRGLANFNLQYFEEAASDFHAVLKLEPDNRAARDQLSIALKKKTEDAARERSIFAGMFHKFAQQDLSQDKDAGRGHVDMFSNIGEWSNDLANGMMTLEQEMAAFGEKMPEPKYRRGGKENERPDSDDD